MPATKKATKKKTQPVRLRGVRVAIFANDLEAAKAQVEQADIAACMILRSTFFGRSHYSPDDHKRSWSLAVTLPVSVEWMHGKHVRSGLVTFYQEGVPPRRFLDARVLVTSETTGRTYWVDVCAIKGVK